ncbi:RNA-guided endonuclease InsQ/TnpB family protein [Salinibacter ruber]|uniref:RNA-guided endonuclease InsQ/TnpB family protein n=1 Tax=Salinibacter ruber TaxID=146919 RepID=UPI002169A358|nr:transposase [Salinibacter ruber]MCS3955325.1 putative transposase [Salinibacter ruber]MCS4059226.1 putative transposase [Salinibacter ruber]MCS4160028.1 putative transposase [Salinibacter ruber]
MRKTYKYRLYTCERNKHLVESIELASVVWNHFVALTRRYYEIYGEYPGYYALKKHLTKLKQRDKGHWYDLNSQALQNVIERLDRAYQRFFEIDSAGRPGFKKREKYTSFTLTQTGWKLLGGNRVRIQNHNYKFVKSRPIKGEIKTVTIKRDACGYLWICFSVEKKPPTPELPRTGNAVGLDFGLKDFLVTSDGDRIQAPEPLQESLEEVQDLHKELSRKKRGSNNRKKAKRRLARKYRQIDNQRKDFHFKLARRLFSRYDVVCIEELNVGAMKELWGRKVSDLGFASFVKILEHVAQKEGKEVRKIDRWFPSSQTCSDCSHRYEDLSLEERTWTCEECGSLHDRDLNAARNVLERALSSAEAGVRPSGAAARVARSS